MKKRFKKKQISRSKKELGKIIKLEIQRNRDKRKSFVELIVYPAMISSKVMNAVTNYKKAIKQYDRPKFKKGGHIVSPGNKDGETLRMNRLERDNFVEQMHQVNCGSVRIEKGQENNLTNI